MLDLNNLSIYRENNRIEAKRAQGGLPLSIWETYSAFANSFGGIILLGVSEGADKTLFTVPLPDPEKLVSEFWNLVNNQSKVSANILTDRDVQIVESGGNRIVAIEIPRAGRHDKPIYIGENPFSGTYRRNGEGDYHCTADEVRNMLRDQADVSQDMRVMETMAFDVFDPESIKRYRIRMANLRSSHVWESLDDTEFLQRLGAMARSEDGVLHPTAAGLLMFGYEYEIVREFPNYFLDYQEKLDSSTRWTDRIVSNSGDWSGNIFDFYFRVYNKIAQDLKIPFKLSGTERIDDTPVHEALREALANALIHSNYYDRRGLVIEKRADEITIANPGSFRVNLKDAIQGGISDPRNATLIKMFNLIGIGERAGSGLPNIHAVWSKQGWGLPRITEAFGPDRVILSLALAGDAKKPAIKIGDKKSAIKIGDKKQLIIELLTRSVSANAQEIAAVIGLKPSRTRDYLKELIAEEVVVAEGGNRNRTYRLKA